MYHQEAQNIYNWNPRQWGGAQKNMNKYGQFFSEFSRNYRYTD